MKGDLIAIICVVFWHCSEGCYSNRLYMCLQNLLLKPQKARQSSFNVGFTLWNTTLQSAVTEQSNNKVHPHCGVWPLNILSAASKNNAKSESGQCFASVWSQTFVSINPLALVLSAQFTLKKICGM